MKYSKARGAIKTGDVLAFRGHWLISKLICWWSGSDVSHVGLAVWLKFDYDKDETLCLIEAMDGLGVRITPLSQALEKYWEHGGKAYWLQTDSHVAFNAVKFAQEHWDESYVSLYQILLAASPKLQFLRGWRGAGSNLDGWHCSELVTRSLMTVGHEPTKLPEYTTPGDVMRFACLRNRVELERG